MQSHHLWRNVTELNKLGDVDREKREGENIEGYAKRDGGVVAGRDRTDRRVRERLRNPCGVSVDSFVTFSRTNEREEKMKIERGKEGKRERGKERQ